MNLAKQSLHGVNVFFLPTYIILKYEEAISIHSLRSFLFLKIFMNRMKVPPHAYVANT